MIILYGALSSLISSSFLLFMYMVWVITRAVLIDRSSLAKAAKKAVGIVEKELEEEERQAMQDEKAVALEEVSESEVSAL